jgi:ABC-type transport system involved in cytochrome c biogenesis permease subunit
LCYGGFGIVDPVYGAFDRIRQKEVGMKSGNEMIESKAATKTSAKSKSTLPDAAPEKGWRKWAPWGITAFFALWIIGNLAPHPVKSPFKIDEFGKLPVVLEGRVQPMDSVARNTLLVMRSKQTLAIEPEGQMSDMAKMFKTKKMPAIEWLLEVMTRPDDADKRKLFRIDHPELKSMLKLPIEEKHFSFDQIWPEREALQNEARRIQGVKDDPKFPGVEEQLRTPFEKSVARLHFAVLTYFRLKNSLQPESSKNFAEEIAAFQQIIPQGIVAWKKKQANEEYKEEDLSNLAAFLKRYERLPELAYPFVVPPEDATQKDGWENMGTALQESLRSGKIPVAAVAYAQMASAYRANNPEGFNKALGEYQGYLKANYPKYLTKGSRESLFNQYEPFIKAISIYITAFLFACAFWFQWSPWLRSTALKLALLALIVHSSGLIFRMYLEGRPPVTSLYSSAIFIGWACVVFGTILERIFPEGIAVAVGSFLGFITLVIAHNLSLDGDTLKVLVAVLDTNIWLATHVVIITLGYASMFVCGLFAIVYVTLGVFTPRLTPQVGKMLSRIVYGIACFSTFFSFTGTVLGGIWADQSWGRFWGWDVKENGALLIVIWCAILLHARWGGIVRERGLMAMAIFGNIVTSFSWFGVNMLGVGLHSYGFMDEAFKWLVAFVASQVLLIGLALLPPRLWASNKEKAAVPGKVKAPKEVAPTPEQLAAAQTMLPRNPAS